MESRELLPFHLLTPDGHWLRADSLGVHSSSTPSMLLEKAIDRMPKVLKRVLKSYDYWLTSWATQYPKLGSLNNTFIITVSVGQKVLGHDLAGPSASCFSQPEIKVLELGWGLSWRLGCEVACFQVDGIINRINFLPGCLGWWPQFLAFFFFFLPDITLAPAIGLLDTAGVCYTAIHSLQVTAG